MDVSQLSNCLICEKELDSPGYNRCRRCGMVCAVITHDELPETPYPVLTIIDFKSKCCNDDIDVYSRFTCSEECHELYMQKLEAQFGEFKKVTDGTTGISYQVPTRLFAEGVKQQDLSKFPIWRGR